MAYYIDTDNFSTATAVWTDAILTIKSPDGYYSFSGNYRQQLDGFLLELISCPTTPVITCIEYTVSTTSSSGQNYSYIDCFGTDVESTVGGAGGYDANTFCAKLDSVILTGSELTLTTNGIC